MKLATTLAALAVAALAASSHAAVIHYTNITSGGILVSNITETNDNSDPTASYYGQPTITGNSIFFFQDGNSGTRTFAAKATANQGTVLNARLSFDVTTTGPMDAAAFLSEFGAVSGAAGGTADLLSSIFVEDSSGHLLAANTGTNSAPLPFTAGPGTTNALWTSGAGADGNAAAFSFHVVIDNDLQAAGNANPNSFALIEKKGIEIDLGTGTGGQPRTPEPASLGLLGLGGLALLTRRRKA